MRASWVSCLTLLLLTVAGEVQAARPVSFRNLDFETVATDERSVAAWTVSGAGYDGERVVGGAAGGLAAARLASREGDKGASTFGLLSQKVLADSYRGRRIRLRAMIRTNGAKAGATLRIDGDDGHPIPIVTRGERPINAVAWTRAEILTDVPKSAGFVTIGLLLQGPGEAFIDDVSLEDLGPAGLGAEASRPLVGRGADNLAAFARAYGYLRFFYPGETAARADWTSIALAGVQQTESATSPADLARRLETLLRPLAPEFRAWATSDAAPASETIPAGLGQRWRHEGVGLGARALFSSRRIPAEAGAADDLFSADLPGGIRVRLPLVTPRRETPAQSVVGPRVDKPAGFIPSDDDRTTRLADVMIAWNVFQHFYPYFDVIGDHWLEQLRPALNGAATGPDAFAFRPVLSRLVAALDDGHGGVTGPGGPTYVLPLAWEWIEGRLVVLAAAPSTGLSAGDVITSIDGREVASLLQEKETLISGATPQWKRWRSSQALRLAERSSVALTGERSDGSRLQVVVQCVSATDDTNLATTRPPPLAELKPGVMYVDLTRIKGADLKAAWPQLASAKGLIFDLRGYPYDVDRDFLTHFSDKTVYSATWNTPVSLRPDRQGVTWKTSQWTLPPSEPRVTGKAVFIADGRAISRAESFLGVVEGAKLGAIIGETTAGTNGDTNPLILPGGYTLSWTGLRVTKQDGTRHHGVGIKPDIEVHRSVAGVRAGRDEQLEAALATVQQNAATR